MNNPCRAVHAVASLVLLLTLARPASSQVTAAAFLGATRTADSSLAVRQPAERLDIVLTPVAYEGRDFESPVYYGFRVGHVLPFAPRLSIEGEFVHLKVFARTDRVVSSHGSLNGTSVEARLPLAAVVQRFSISHGVNFVLLNAVVRYPLDREEQRHRVVFVGRAGAGPTVPHPETVINGRAQQHYQWGSPAVQAAAGVELRIVRGVYAIADYKLTRSSQVVRVADGEARTVVQTYHVVFGMGLRF